MGVTKPNDKYWCITADDCWHIIDSIDENRDSATTLCNMYYQCASEWEDFRRPTCPHCVALLPARAEIPIRHIDRLIESIVNEVLNEKFGAGVAGEINIKIPIVNGYPQSILGSMTYAKPDKTPKLNERLDKWRKYSLYKLLQGIGQLSKTQIYSRYANGVCSHESKTLAA